MANGDAFGFGTAEQGVTTRPTGDPRGLNGTDTYAADCTSPTSNDGTNITAEWGNEVAGNLKALARINGTKLDGSTPIAVEDHSDGMLAAAVQQWLQRRRPTFFVASGSATAITGAVVPAPAELLDGMDFTFKAGVDAADGGTTLALNGFAAAPVLRVGGAAIAAKDWLANDIVTVRRNGANWRLRAIVANEVLTSSSHGQCRLVLGSSTAVTLRPQNGGRVTIAGAGATLPAAGVSAGLSGVAVNGVNGSLANNTPYYVSVALISNVPTLRFWAASAYGHMPDTTPGNIGVEVIANAGAPLSTDTLVGMVHIDASGQYKDQDGARYLLSWFNRRRKTSTTGFTANRSTTSTSFVELGSDIRNGFISWADEVLRYVVTGSYTTSASTYCGAQTAMSFDGPSAPEATMGVNQPFNNPSSPSPLSFAGTKSGLAEGSAHFATLLGLVQANTGTWAGGSPVLWTTSVVATQPYQLSLDING